MATKMFAPVPIASKFVAVTKTIKTAFVKDGTTGSGSTRPTTGQMYPRTK